MIPTFILLGLVLGRWWRTLLVASAVVWPVTLVASDLMGITPDLLGAAALAAANAAAGVLVHQGVRHAIHHIASDDPAAEAS